MKNIYRFFGSTALLLVVFLSGCDGFVDVDRPNSQLTSDAVFESVTTANAAVADLYAQLREDSPLTGKSSGISLLLGIYADEMDFYSGSSSAEFYNNSLLSANPNIMSHWNESYNIIYASNLVLQKTEGSPLTADSKAQFMGEALFIRSMLHFYLASLFGDVPYITGTDYTQNATVTRTPYSVVMDNVVMDLEEAITLLPESYVTPDRARANKAAARALLARVYLYNERWADAANMASAVINDASFGLEELENTFLRGSTSTILQFAPAYEGHNTDEAPVFIFLSGPPSTVALTQDLMASFEPGDLREQAWTKQVVSGTNSWYHPFKYKQRDDTGSSVELSILLRLSEQYLIRAEARARQGELSTAQADLDVIRNAAGLPGTAATTQDGLIAAILAERRMELFSEYGHRFLDLKRTGILDTTLAAKPGWNTTDSLWPLPLSELLANPFLGQQNPGY